jgi:signal transduction histidine kinase
MPGLKAAYRELEQKTRELAAFLSVSEVLTSLTDLSDLDVALGSALDKTLEIMKQDAGGICLLDEETKMLTYRVHRGLSERFVSEMRLRLGEGIAGKVVESGKVMLSEDISFAHQATHPDLVAAEKLRAFVSVPLRAKGKILGVVDIGNRGSHKFSDGDIRLLEGITRQIATAIDNARLHRELQYKDKARQELLGEILSIQEEERRRIARELHDETSQVLTSLSANLEVAVELLPAGTDKVRAILRKAQALSTNVLEETHKLIYQLRPTMLDDLGLVAAMRWLIDGTMSPAGVKASFRVIGRERRLPSNVETTLFRVVQETVSNITRHARAGNAAVVLHFKRGMIAVHVSDDGCGFDVAEAVSSKDRPRGLGLLGMRERIELVNGTISILSYPGSNGTKVDIEIPLSKGD